MQVRAWPLAVKERFVLCVGARAIRPAAVQLVEAIKILLCSAKVTRPLLGDIMVEAVLLEDRRPVNRGWLLCISLTVIPPGAVLGRRAQTLLLQSQYNALLLSTERKCMGRAPKSATGPILWGRVSGKVHMPNELLPSLSKKQIASLLGDNIGPWLLFVWLARPARTFAPVLHS